MVDECVFEAGKLKFEGTSHPPPQSSKHTHTPSPYTHAHFHTSKNTHLNAGDVRHDGLPPRCDQDVVGRVLLLPDAHPPGPREMRHLLFRWKGLCERCIGWDGWLKGGWWCVCRVLPCCSDRCQASPFSKVTPASASTSPHTITHRLYPKSNEQTQQTHPVDDLDAAVLEQPIVYAIQAVHVRVARLLDGLPVEAEGLRDGLGGLVGGSGRSINIW
jgi:hypothetical protein